MPNISRTSNSQNEVKVSLLRSKAAMPIKRTKNNRAALWRASTLTWRFSFSSQNTNFLVTTPLFHTKNTISDSRRQWAFIGYTRDVAVFRLLIGLSESGFLFTVVTLAWRKMSHFVWGSRRSVRFLINIAREPTPSGNQHLPKVD